MNKQYPRTFSHIGISVPDLEAAVTFYTEVLGWYIILKPTEINEDDSSIGVMCTDVFGSGWEHFRIAHMSTGDRIGVELFDKIVAAGGKKRMKEPRYYYPGKKPYRMIYMEDPFGNILEIYSHSYELTYADGAY
jgi:catechol 2,3-dioxygenase-like lactoylglutathione lyase family enzyme